MVVIRRPGSPSPLASHRDENIVNLRDQHGDESERRSCCKQTLLHLLARHIWARLVEQALGLDFVLARASNERGRGDDEGDPAPLVRSKALSAPARSKK